MATADRTGVSGTPKRARRVSRPNEPTLSDAQNGAETAKTRYVTYFRVSTDKQCLKSLGIQAQQLACEQFVRTHPGKVLKTFTEVESGERDDRPELAKALTYCKRTGATLLIAKLDRLSRDTHFLLGLQKAGVGFICADMPHANNLTVGIMALVAQQEREAISERTNATTAKADEFAQSLADIVLPLRAKGTPLAEIAAHLTKLGMKTPRGGTWYPSSVRNLLLRLDV